MLLIDSNVDAGVAADSCDVDSCDVDADWEVIREGETIVNDSTFVSNSSPR